MALTLIDAPDVTLRETMSDAGLESLAESLRALGQLEEIGLVVTGERFRVVYGHRRRIALERAGFTHARALVFPAGTATEQAMKVAENAEQEAVNVVAQATYYAHLLETQANNDVRVLCQLVNRKESFVLDRLDLLRGDPEILQALRDERISQAVARQLNKVPNELYRRSFLADAVRDGWNERTARHNRQELARTLRYNEAAKANGGAVVPPSSESPLVSIDACPLCYSDADQHDMEYVRVHRSCRAVFQRQQAARDRGERESA